MQVVLQGRAEAAEPDVEADEGGDPESVEAVLGLPDAAGSFAHPQRQLVVEGEPVQLAADATEPGSECDLWLDQLLLLLQKMRWQ